MSARVSIPIRLGLQVSVDGTDHDPVAFKVLPIQLIRSFRTTNVVTMGSAKASFSLLHRPKDEWLYHHLANDVITLLASVGGTKGTPKQYMIWKGLLDNPQHSLDISTGSTFQIEASTFYKKFEVTTEGDFASGNTDFATYVVSNGGIPASTIINLAADRVGFPPNGTPGRQIDTSGPDIRSAQTPIVGFDPSSYPGVNHQFVSFSNVIAGAAQMVGRELFTNEQGQLIYRKSHFEDPPVGSIRKEWVISPVVSIDSDVGLANEVRVNYGLGQQVNLRQGIANAPSNYPMDHFGVRQLNVSAPWIIDPASAQWYADWILTWAMHNTRPGIVKLAFAPDIVCGECYVIPYPRPAVYYVMSVVHNYVAGQPPTTTLGLSYGREIGAKQWFTLPAPTDFGGQSGGAAQAVLSPSVGDILNLPTGTRWRITHYTPAGLGSSTDTSGNTYLTGGYTYLLYKDYYLRPNSDTKHLYSSVRECAIDPDYVIPELSLTATDPSRPAPPPVKLTGGDMLILKSSGIIVEVGDKIGTDALSFDSNGNVVPTFSNGARNPAAVGPDGRQLDLFYWTDTGLVLPDYDDVEYLYVQALGMSKPAFGDAVPGQSLPPSTSLGRWTDGGAVASTAAYCQSVLLPDNSGRNRVAPGRGDVALFCHSYGWWYPSAPADLHNPPTPEEDAVAGDCQCTVLCMYAYARNGVTLRNLAYAYTAAQPDGWLADGMVDITGSATIPAPGDILVFSRHSSDSDPNGDITGHVAIIHDVTPPSDIASGSVTVCQSNCLVGQDGLPIVRTWPLVRRGIGYRVLDNTPNTFGPTVQSVLRYGGGGT